MKRTLLAVALLATVGAANATVSLVGGTSIDNFAAALSSYGPFYAGSPLNIAFRDSSDGSSVPDGGNPLSFASYVVLGNTDGGGFTPYTKGGEYDFVLGFNDSYKYDADHNDLVVGFKVSVVPEPETYALLLAGLGIMGFIARTYSRGSEQPMTAAMAPSEGNRRM
jgi:hypothetical protein